MILVLDRPSFPAVMQQEDSVTIIELSCAITCAAARHLQRRRSRSLIWPCHSADG